MSYVQLFAHKCDAPGCDVEHNSEVRVPLGGVLENIATPDGWRKVGWMTFCPAHRVLIVVDGMESEGWVGGAWGRWRERT